MESQEYLILGYALAIVLLWGYPVLLLAAARRVARRERRGL